MVVVPVPPQEDPQEQPAEAAQGEVVVEENKGTEKTEDNKNSRRVENEMKTQDITTVPESIVVETESAEMQEDAKSLKRGVDEREDVVEEEVVEAREKNTRVGELFGDLTSSEDEEQLNISEFPSEKEEDGGESPAPCRLLR